MHKGINFKDQSQVLHTDSFVNKADNSVIMRMLKIWFLMTFNFVLFHVLNKFKHCCCVFL